MRPSDNVCFGSFQYSQAALFASAAKASSRSLAHVVATTLITTKWGQVFLKSHFKFTYSCIVSSKSREIEAIFRTGNETVEVQLWSPLQNIKIRCENQLISGTGYAFWLHPELDWAPLCEWDIATAPTTTAEEKAISVFFLFSSQLERYIYNIRLYVGHGYSSTCTGYV